MTGTTRFVFRGEIVELENARPTMSVLEWLRQSDGLRGTKEGCNQGDCGACTVAIAELHDDGLRLSTANSCLMLVAMLDGKALFTVEDIGTPQSMHPVQQALVDHGGSQCGYCTPGFVVSMWARIEQAAHDGEHLTRPELIEALSGNLCRCTGYRPILEAAAAASQAVAASGSAAVGWEQVATALASLRTGSSSDSHAETNRFRVPATEEQLARDLAEHPQALVIAGGTDLVVSMRADGRILGDDISLVSTRGVATMSEVSQTSTHLVIGAACTIEASWQVLVLRAPALDRMRRRFASPAIRGTGTIGGNIANSSPIADLVPVLIALDAELELRSSQGERRVPVAGFATGPRANILEPGEFIARVHVPLASFDREIRADKVSRRFDDDIAAVSGVLASSLQDGSFADVRLVFGGMAATVRRAMAAEAELLGRPWDQATLQAAQHALGADFAPIDDHRASGWYRLQAARGLLERWWFDAGIDAPAAPLDVWTLA